MRRVLTIGMLSVLAACSGISVNQDFVPGIDFESYQTYAWMPNQGETSGSNPMANQKHLEHHPPWIPSSCSPSSWKAVFDRTGRRWAVYPPMHWFTGWSWKT